MNPLRALGKLPGQTDILTLEVSPVQGRSLLPFSTANKARSAAPLAEGAAVEGVFGLMVSFIRIARPAVGDALAPIRQQSCSDRFLV